jgi:hypothetical protein
MRKFLKYLSIIFFITNSPNYLYANIDNIFGIKIFDNVSKYAKIKNGKTTNFLPKNIYTFADKDLRIERDPIFDYYYLRTNKNFKIINVTAGKRFFSQKNNFQNDCSKIKNKFISELSQSLDINPKVFISTHSKIISKFGEERKHLWDNSIYKYKDNEKEYVLAIYCSYSKNNNDSLSSRMLISWITDDYHKKYVLTRSKKIKKFNDKFILKYLFDE